MENKYGVEFGYSYDKYGCNTKYCNIKLCENQLISITYDIFTEYIEYHQKLIPYGIIRFEYEDYKSEIKIIEKIIDKKSYLSIDSDAIDKIISEIYSKYANNIFWIYFFLLYLS